MLCRKLKRILNLKMSDDNTTITSFIEIMDFLKNTP